MSSFYDLLQSRNINLAELPALAQWPCLKHSFARLQMRLVSFSCTGLAGFSHPLSKVLRCSALLPIIGLNRFSHLLCLHSRLTDTDAGTDGHFLGLRLGAKSGCWDRTVSSLGIANTNLSSSRTWPTHACPSAQAAEWSYCRRSAGSCGHNLLTRFCLC
ncbi:hypothetical protein F4604DRAFT_1768693, partial [Suillus subluteus]